MQTISSSIVCGRCVNREHVSRHRADERLKDIYCADDPALYEKCLVRPVGQIDRQAIIDEKANIAQIIATLGLKDMTQGTLIRKLCTYTQPNPTRRALFEFDKLIRSILRYLRDPQLQRNVHRSQNRIESYHQLRSVIAQVGGKKELTGRTDIEIEISNQCARLIAETLLPILEQETGTEGAALASAKEALAAFEPQFEAARTAGLRRKLGLFTERADDAALAEHLLECMAANGADFTLTFRRLCDAAAGPERDAGVRALFADQGAYDSWAVVWRQRLEEEAVPAEARGSAMRMESPAFIPRNHLVEAALEAAMWRQNFQPFEQLLDVVSRPYEDRPELEQYATKARPEESVSRTFCGT